MGSECFKRIMAKANFCKKEDKHFLRAGMMVAKNNLLYEILSLEVEGTLGINVRTWSTMDSITIDIGATVMVDDSQEGGIHGSKGPINVSLDFILEAPCTLAVTSPEYFGEKKGIRSKGKLMCEVKWFNKLVTLVHEDLKVETMFKMESNSEMVRGFSDANFKSTYNPWYTLNGKLPVRSGTGVSVIEVQAEGELQTKYKGIWFTFEDQWRPRGLTSYGMEALSMMVLRQMCDGLAMKQGLVLYSDCKGMVDGMEKKKKPSATAASIINVLRRNSQHQISWTKGHPEKGKKLGELNEVERGIYISDLLGRDIHTREKGLEKLKPYTYNIIDTPARDIMNWVLNSECGAVVVEVDDDHKPTIFLGKINVQNSAELKDYLTNRETFASGDHPVDYWPNATRKLASTIWNLKGRSYGARASAVRVMFDKGYHGGNQSKWKCSTIDKCPLCGEMDSNEHWIVGCQSYEMRVLSEDAMDSLREEARTAPVDVRGAFNEIIKWSRNTKYKELGWIAMPHTDDLDTLTNAISANTDYRKRKEVMDATRKGLKILCDAARQRWKERVKQASKKRQNNAPGIGTKRMHTEGNKLNLASKGTASLDHFFHKKEASTSTRNNNHSYAVMKGPILTQTSIRSFLTKDRVDRTGIG